MRSLSCGVDLCCCFLVALGLAGAGWGSGACTISSATELVESIPLKKTGRGGGTPGAKQSRKTKGKESRRDEKREGSEVERGEQGRGVALCLFTLKESE